MSNGSTRQRVVLVVLDGWGYRREHDGNAIELASTPVWHRLWASSPRTLLDASGLAVGLPEGQMGNSEVGHLNLGAGRVVAQDLVRISQSIQSGEFYQIPALVDLCSQLRQSGGTLHLVGLLGPGGRARARPSPARLRRAGRAPAGADHRHPRVPRRPRLVADPRGGSRPDAAARHAADRRDAGGHRLADRALLRHGPRPALGPDPAGLRRDGARHRHAGGASGARRAGGLPARRDRRVHPSAGAPPGRPARGHDARRRRSAVLQLPQRPDAPDRERAGDPGVRRVRSRPPPGALLRHHDAVRPDLPAAAGLSAVQPRADPGRGPRRPGADPVPDSGDGEVPARHLLLQRRLRAAVPWRGALPHPLAARGDVRPGAGDERRRASPTLCAARSNRGTTISSSATTPTRTWWDTPGCCRP